MVRELVAPVPRTCTELRIDANQKTIQRHEPKPLSAFRDFSSYVLLGDPGIGKSTSLTEEQAALGETTLFISARDFITFDPANHPEWQDKTLFIDGLDEIRTDGTDPRTPFDRIRQNLDELGKPPFRLSCRHADWLNTDQESLEYVSSSGSVTVLSLDPLNLEGMTQLLERNSQLSDVSAFLLEAHDRGMEAMLTNPQSLLMLADTVSSYGWPSSRKELFERACQDMAREFNEEHLDSKPTTNVSQILDDTGRISAVLLLSNTPGCSTSPNYDSPEYPYLNRIGIPIDASKVAIATNLFRAAPNRVEFVHRHVAEFLAARYLASLVEKGLPVRRVLSQMIDRQGNVVTSLRGLSAWLAVHSRVARTHLMLRDPVGIAQYGELEILSDDERFHLFQSLIGDPMRLEPTYLTGKAFAGLVTPSMHEVLKQSVVSPPSGPNASIVVDFVLRLFAGAHVVPEMRDTLVEHVRDRSQPNRVHESALEALIEYSKATTERELLLDLVDEVNEGKIRDPNDQLIGKLLSTLFPSLITATDVWDYVKEGDGTFGGSFMRFWIHDLPQSASDTDIAVLLDGCSARSTKLSTIGYSPIRTCIGQLIMRGLDSYGDSIEISRLYDWLNTGIEIRVNGNRRWRNTISISKWIEDRPDLHPKIVLEGILRSPKEEWTAAYDAQLRLYGAHTADDFHEECIVQAIVLAEAHPHIAESVLRYVLQTKALDENVVRDLVIGNAKLCDFVNDVLLQLTSANTELQSKRPRSDVIDRLLQRDRDEYEALKKLEPELREGTVQTAVLHNLAKVFFDDFLGFSHESAIARVNDLTMSDEELQAAIHQALADVSTRDDLPSVNEILQLSRNSRMHFLTLPFLASIALRESEKDYQPNIWTEDQIQKAVAVYFAYAHGQYVPLWYKHLIRDNPKIVADIQVEYAVAFLQDGSRQADTNLWCLAFDPNHAAVARISVVPILQKFPISAKKELLYELECLLVAARRYVDTAQFHAIIASKLRLKSMPTRQRARWLAAGCMVATSQYAKAAKHFVSTGRKQTRLFDFLSLYCPPSHDLSLIDSSDLQLQALLIQISGPYIDPDDFGKGGIVTIQMDMSRRIQDYIQNIATDPSVEATEILDELQRDTDLSRWHYQLTRLARDQKRVRIDHEFSTPSFEQVVDFLANGLPTNPGDLVALSISLLEEIGESVGATDSDDWKQYWNEDGRGRPTEPRSENSCTQNVLRDLKTRLPEGVHCELYGSYSRGTSSDLKVIYKNFNIPVEAKCNWIQDLWRAAESQLMTKYTIDPATGGFGIYLVYWFGKDCTPRSPQGTRPATAKELRRQLESSLTEEDRHRISICVIDVSKDLPTRQV